MHTNRVSIIILTYNSLEHLPDLFQSIAVQTHPDIELIVIDNASQDGTVAWLKQQTMLKLDHLVCNPTNVWFAKGSNQGIILASGEFILLCNDDVILEAKYIAKLVLRMHKDAQCGLAGGKILKLTKTNGQSIVDSAGLESAWSGRVVNRGENRPDIGQFDQPEEVFGITGAVMLLRRSALESIRYQDKTHDEYIDEDFVAYKDDVDVSWRLERAGYTIWYEPAAVAHHARTIQQTDLAQRHIKPSIIRAYSYRNHIWLLVKNLSFTDFILRAPWMLPYEFAKFLYICVAEWSTVKIIPQLISKLPTIWRKRSHYV